MVKLYPNIGSLAIEENVQAIKRNTVNAANVNNHGTIRFSCSCKQFNYTISSFISYHEKNLYFTFRKADIKIRLVTKITAAAIIENNENSTNKFLTENNYLNNQSIS